MEILLIVGLVAVIALPLHLLNLRDADQRELAAAIKADPRLRLELMCARDYQEAKAAASAPAVENVHEAEEADELPHAA